MKQLIACVAFLAIGSVSRCGEKPLAWSQFRGTNGAGIAEGQKPPVEFGPGKNVKWKVPAPAGVSSPIVAGNNLVLTAFDGGKLVTIAYNRADGKEAWRAEAPAKKIEPFHKKESSPASSTPATDGKRIVSYFGSCGLFCYDLDGKELWRYELPMAIILGNFGSGVSPIIADDTVILLRDVANEPKILAVNLTTGKLKWETKRLSKVSYGTPVVWDTPAGKQVVAPGHARMIAYDLQTGDEKWSVAGIPSGCCASPVAANGVLYFAGMSSSSEADKMPSFDDMLKLLDKNKDGVITKDETVGTQMYDFFDHQDQNGDGKLTRDEWDVIGKFMAEGKNVAFAVKPGGAGDVTKSHLLWKTTKGLPYITTALLYRGQYVMVRDGGMVTAYDAKSGKAVYTQERAAGEGRYYASPVAANGNIYFTSLENGAVTVVKAGLDRPEVVATNSELGERVSATPAIADDTLYIRTAGHLYAFAEKK